MLCEKCARKISNALSVIENPPTITAPATKSHGPPNVAPISPPNLILFLTTYLLKCNISTLKTAILPSNRSLETLILQRGNFCSYSYAKPLVNGIADIAQQPVNVNVERLPATSCKVETFFPIFLKAF